MVSIVEKIVRSAAEFEANTGRKPTRVYLGRKEDLALGKWAYENSYQEKDGPAAREGKARPEVVGLAVYVVNDDEPHLACCA